MAGYFEIIEGTLRKYTGDEAVVTVPEGVVKIGRGAFWYNLKLREVILPSSVKNIRSRAFKGCRALEKVMLPEELRSICAEAFMGCSSLQKIHIPKTVLEVSKRVFADCTSLEELYIPETVQEISGDAMKGCPNIRKMTIPSKSWWNGLKNFSALEEVVVLRNEDDRHCNAFWGERFANCSSLKKVIIPEGLSYSIGRGCFSNCTALEEIVLPEGGEEIKEEAFLGCTNLKYITIPDSMEKISVSAFKDCHQLTVKASPQWLDEHWNIEMVVKKQTRFVIPEGATEIKQGTFPASGTVDELVIPDSVERVDRKLFIDSWREWYNVKITASDTWKKKHWEIMMWLDPQEVLVIPEGVTQLEDGFCFGNPVVQEVQISSTVQSIGSVAFARCFKLKKIYIPDSVQEIALNSFEKAPNIEIIASNRWKRKHWRCHHSLKQYAPWWQKLFCRQ